MRQQMSGVARSDTQTAHTFSFNLVGMGTYPIL